MAKDRARDDRRSVGSFEKMGAALGWKRDDSSWADSLQVNNGQSWPKNAIKKDRLDNSGINKHHEGDWRKDRNEVYNVGGGHVKLADDPNKYNLG